MTDPNLIKALYEIKEAVSIQSFVISMVGLAVVLSLFALYLGQKK